MVGDDDPMGAVRLLVVEDDTSLRQAVDLALRRVGYEVSAHGDLAGIDEVLATFHPDLALLDVRLPGDDHAGFSLGARLHEAGGVPVLFMTAADELTDRLRGFELGADDYLVKPFAMAELLARVRAVLRRSGRLQPELLRLGDVVMDEGPRTVRRGDASVVLTRTEFDLLAALVRGHGRVQSKVQLLSLVWGFDGYDPNLVEVHVSSLRRKLDRLGVRLVHTERGSGYLARLDP